MANSSIEMTIMFADITGSTLLYNRLGDKEAHNKVVACLKLMGNEVEHYQGQVVETIGDEIMCSFYDSHNAIHAAQAIQEAMQPEAQNGIGARVGMQSGLTSIDKGHPFGDVVNMAARMAGLARTGQIVTTEDTVQRLPSLMGAFVRPLGRVKVKGKPDPIETYEILWDREGGTNVTLDVPMQSTQSQLPKATVMLRSQQGNVEVTDMSPDLALGRNTQNDLVVGSANASRNHASIECRNGHIVFVDHSSNGSYIRTNSSKPDSDGLNLFLHRDEWVMDSTGVISLGEPIQDSSVDLIHFASVRH